MSTDLHQTQPSSTDPNPTRTSRATGLSGGLRAGLALARMEATLFVRNKTAVVNATVIPLLLALAFASIAGSGGAPGLVLAIGMGIGACLMFVVYYSLVTSVVARRQAGVLKRLSTGTVSRPGILAALSAPLLVLFAVEVALISVLAALLIGQGLTHPLIIVLTVIVSGLTWTLLALASTIVTKTAESAQLSTLPLIIGALALSSLSLPVSWLPDWARVISELSPLRPVVDLTWLAVTGAQNPEELWMLPSTAAAVGMELAVLVVWAALAGYALRRMRWEARA